MSEESEHDAADDDGHATEQSEAEGATMEDENRDRVTSPMQDYSIGQVTTGFVVLLVGIAVAYALPALF